MCALRRIALAGTELVRATCSTIRLKLLKIGAQVTISARRVRIAWRRPVRRAPSSPSPMRDYETPGAPTPRPPDRQQHRNSDRACPTPPPTAAAPPLARRQHDPTKPGLPSTATDGEKSGLGSRRLWAAAAMRCRILRRKRSLKVRSLLAICGSAMRCRKAAWVVPGDPPWPFDIEHPGPFVGLLRLRLGKAAEGDADVPEEVSNSRAGATDDDFLPGLGVFHQEPEFDVLSRPLLRSAPDPLKRGVCKLNCAMDSSKNGIILHERKSKNTLSTNISRPRMMRSPGGAGSIAQSIPAVLRLQR